MKREAFTAQGEEIFASDERRQTVEAAAGGPSTVGIVTDEFIVSSVREWEEIELHCGGDKRKFDCRSGCAEVPSPHISSHHLTEG